ncbi:hypothetical protein KR215_002136 [Drosophila sulfurigaster]|nr:hypothetical protein KR215_002136 [Drosophila sulfurigaster]
MSDNILKSTEEPSECELKKEDNAEETKPILTTLTNVVPPHLNKEADFDNSDNDENGEPKDKRQKLICWLEPCDKPPGWHEVQPESVSDDEEEDSDDEGEEEDIDDEGEEEEEEESDDGDVHCDIQYEELDIPFVDPDDQN